MATGYIGDIRKLVGHMPLILDTAGGILLNDRHQVLLNLRTDTHNWSLPGGYMEFGETFAQTCVREYKEDSGLDVEIVRPLKLFDQGIFAYPNGDKVQTITQLFLVRKVGGELLSAATDETLRLDYFDFGKLPPLLNTQTEQMLAFAEEHL
ncbi:NUDIX hydrolase [Lentilactobacillus otakiensis]|uniref:NTP pyrophosphohydrolase n=1 Tax=Lentilactobacillus otakiensis DSM 19908 = JCM 15040 TaxID=1423780 RepID=S4NCD4_9LACO|nr:NUDIX hydrolase [Lentilactobacillus otakiensis]KRL10114.1 NUDIX hydrolase [Lentilactobacillus otakiensis DSM 19908 = JCM 15040]MBZ3776371.1 NUDIX hydrolase [Lentilactobacillus otakiensis]MDV3517966.1 NUDIX hydrolase [Lentilactobacillus otakiensis]GAD16474.1 NTP pyrophosphohydrolase [Lentilactobacillus otakiensis DSM 19908 = JCM 15040]